MISIKKERLEEIVNVMVDYVDCRFCNRLGKDFHSCPGDCVEEIFNILTKNS